MKEKFAILTLTLFCLFVFSSVEISHAQWDAINSGYGITTNWHGKVVPLGESVTAWAGTTNSSITAIFFRWKRPDGSIFAEFNCSSIGQFNTASPPADAPEEIKDWAEKHPGITVYYATNTQTPDTLGNWTVKAYFIGPGGQTKEEVENTIQIRATSFNTIPDFPVVGTAGALVTMLVSLNLFLRRGRKQN